ncbi:MAG: endonuclease domain-containing protein [Oscillospiraceae bacterium]|nr:endonuclease domain-containing protein [Oscillospiraceae bacterium]
MSQFLPRNKSLKPFSSNLRSNMTKQENRLWYDYLRGLPLQFSRQRIIGGYIADFYCDKLKLVIELDGSQHYEQEALVYDAERTAYFESLGLAVLRFTNTEVDHQFEGVCTTVQQIVYNHLL